MSGQFLSIDEVAFVLNVSEQTVRKLIKKGRIHAVKIGRIYRIPQESITEFSKGRIKIHQFEI